MRLSRRNSEVYWWRKTAFSKEIASLLCFELNHKNYFLEQVLPKSEQILPVLKISRIFSKALQKKFWKALFLLILKFRFYWNWLQRDELKARRSLNTLFAITYSVVGEESLILK